MFYFLITAVMLTAWSGSNAELSLTAATSPPHFTRLWQTSPRKTSGHLIIPIVCLDLHYSTYRWRCKYVGTVSAELLTLLLRIRDVLTLLELLTVTHPDWQLGFVNKGGDTQKDKTVTVAFLKSYLKPLFSKQINKKDFQWKKDLFWGHQRKRWKSNLWSRKQQHIHQHFHIV